MVVTPEDKVAAEDVQINDLNLDKTGFSKMNEITFTFTDLLV
ncbi:hypothetical protein [Gynurincola endophyticus]|nr:hypothetical protein [Gynurincola endophyticus]